MKLKAFLCITAVSCLFALIQCGEIGTKEKSELDVVFLDVDNNIPVGAMEEIVQSYKDAHQDIIVNTKTAEIEADATYSTMAEQFKNADVIIFPSVIEDTLSPRSSSFYTISATSTNLPESIAQHYQTSNQELWAQPLLYDPVIQIIRKDAVKRTGDQFFPRSWSKIAHISQLGIVDDTYPVPQLKIYDPKEYGLTDTLAAYYLSRGLFYDVVVGKGLSDDMSMDLHRIAQFDILKTIALFTTGNRDKLDFSFDFVKTLEEFNESNGMFTFLRYSSFIQKDPTFQSNFYWGIAPSIYDEKPVLCYSVNAAIPIDGDQPEMAKEFISYITNMPEEGLKPNGYFTVNELPTSELFPENHFIVIRSNSNKLHEKVFYDCLQKKKDILEFNGIWLSGFSILKNHG